MRSVKIDSINQTDYFVLKDATTGAPKTGVTLTTIDLTYTRTRAAHVKQDASALGSVNAAHTDWGVFEVSSTEAPGLYRADFPDAAFATGSDAVRLGMTAPDCDPAYKEIVLIAADASDLATIATTLSSPVDSNLVEIAGSTSGVSGFDRATRAITVGTVTTGATTTSIPTSSLTPAASVTDQFKGQVLAFDKDTTTAALRGEKTVIQASTSGGTFTVTALTTAPASGDTFTIQ